MSKVTQAQIRCPHCHSISEYNIWISANVTVSPYLRDEVLSGSLFWKDCPKCTEGFSASHDLLYHDMEKQFCVWLKYPNAAGEIEMEPGADRADRVFKSHWLRIVFSRDELTEKIKIAQDGYDDIFIEALKVFHSAKFDIDFESAFYYDRTENRMSRKTIVFVHRPDGAAPIEHTMDLREARSAIEPFVPKIGAAIKSDWSPWMWVTRPTVLMTFEECGLLSGMTAPETVQNISDYVLEKAETLVTMANSVAVDLNSAENKLQLPYALTDDVENWHFLVTVAGVFSALHALSQRVSEETIDGITSGKVLLKLDQWNPKGSRAFSDCRQFVEGALECASNEQVDLTSADAIGMWLLCKLYRRFPTPEETVDARPLGEFLLETFDEWWVEAN
ncbi:MAG: CpXC domain-containing protein [Pyrinomonadaceae bacterium]